MYYSLFMRDTDVEWDDDKNEINKREHEGMSFELVPNSFLPTRIVLSVLIGAKATRPGKSGGKLWAWRGKFFLRSIQNVGRRKGSYRRA